MTATEILAAATERGITLRRVGDKLRYRPKQLMTPQLAALLTEHKASLLDLLASMTGNEAVQSVAAGCEQAIRIAEGDSRQADESSPGDGWPDCHTIPIDEVQPCAKCRRIDHWQDGLGNWKCRRCQPPKWSGRALLNMAERLHATGVNSGRYT